MQTKKWLPVFVLLVVPMPLAATSKPAARPAAHAAHASVAPSSNKNNAAYSAYLGRLRGKLMNNWDVPNGRNKVTVSTTVNADGSIGEVLLSSTPKSAAAEIAGSEAFAKSQPLEAIPGGGQVKLILTFESSADPHGDSNSNVYTQIVPVPTAKVAPTNTGSAPTAEGAPATEPSSAAK